MLEVPLIMSICLLTLIAVCSETLRKFLDIQVTSWILRRQGVSPEKIQEYALAQARKQRPKMLIEVLKLLIKSIQSIKK